MNAEQLIDRYLEGTAPGDPQQVPAQDPRGPIPGQPGDKNTDKQFKPANKGVPAHSHMGHGYGKTGS